MFFLRSLVDFAKSNKLAEPSFYDGEVLKAKEDIESEIKKNKVANHMKKGMLNKTALIPL